MKRFLSTILLSSYLIIAYGQPLHCDGSRYLVSVFDEVSEESSSLSSPASPSPSLQKGRYLQITNLDSHKVSFSSKNPKH